MIEITQYIDFNQDLHGEPVYLPYTWQQSVPIVGVGHQVIIPTIQGSLTTFILIKQMVMQMPATGTGLPIVFTDTRYPLNPIFTLIDNGLPWVQGFNFDYVAKNDSLIIQANHSDMLFSLGYVRVTQQDKRDKEKK